MAAAVPHGLCAKFTTAAPFAGEIQTIPVEEPRGILRSWDVRADWRAAIPRAPPISIVRTAKRGVSCLVRQPGRLRPARPRQITMDLTGYVRARESGIFALQVGTDIISRARWTA